MKLPGSRKGAAPPKAEPASVRGVNYSNSPLLVSRTPVGRSKLLVAVVGLGFCVLLGRAAYVQVFGADFYLKQGEIRYAHTLTLPASRGRILDRNGQLMASSVPAPSLWVIPKDFDADPAARRELAGLLGMKPRALEDRLDDSPNFIWLGRQLDDQVAAQALALRLPGLHKVNEFRRRYPEGESAAHVVGFTDVENRGQEGVELAFQKDLIGRKGSRRVIKDRLGRVIEDIGDSVEPVDGRDIQLSIDSKLQFFAYRRIRDAVAENKAKAGSVVVLDAKSGEVLALANFPSYAPADRRNLTGEQLRNRALTDTFEPGSTMKPFTIGLALETGRVKPETVIQTAPGRINITGTTISDVHPNGELTVNGVIQKSSNVGTVKIAMQMQPREMWELYTQIGLGQKPQIEFPGAVSGRLRPYKTWRPIEQATMSYGYGLSASLFQLARAYTVFAHDGELIPITLLKPESADNARVAGMRVMSPQTARAMRHMLQLAAGPGGTAQKAQTIGYSVGGKSGTTYKQEGKGYAGSSGGARKYRSFFVGMSPISDPRIIVAVMVDEPSAGRHYGGEVAAPVFSDVVQQTLRTLNVLPDLEVRARIQSQPLDVVEESF